MLLKRVWYLLFSMIAVICAIGNVLPSNAKEAWIVLMRFLFLGSGDCFVRNEAFTSPILRETSLASLRISVVNRKEASFDTIKSSGIFQYDCEGEQVLPEPGNFIH